MTVLTLALLAGSQPAAPRLAPVHQIGPQSRRQSPHTPCAPLVRTDALTLTWQKADRYKRSAPTSSSHTPWPNPHSACGTAAAPLPAISCLGAFRPPAARARGEVRHCRQPKTCTTSDICTAANFSLFDHLVGAAEQCRRHSPTIGRNVPGPEVGAMIHDPLVTWGSYEIQTAIGWP
jgi:hypothetical protein